MVILVGRRSEVRGMRDRILALNWHNVDREKERFQSSLIASSRSSINIDRISIADDADEVAIIP
ncbi:hypothetical protein QUA82_18930 [Microcoleus sp. F8-D3]